MTAPPNASITTSTSTSRRTWPHPFLIDETGVQVIPITSLGLQRGVSEERVPTGTRGLDEMLGGQGFCRGSSVLVSGTAGTGKTGRMGDDSTRDTTAEFEEAIKAPDTSHYVLRLYVTGLTPRSLAAIETTNLRTAGRPGSVSTS